MVKSWVVGGGGSGWPVKLYCHLLGLGVISIAIPIPIPNPSPSRLTIAVLQFQSYQSWHLAQIKLKTRKQLALLVAQVWEIVVKIFCFSLEL